MSQDSAAHERHDLQRFVHAQNGVFTQVLAELKRGEKTTHWMWFIFPQIEGLGSSARSQRFAIRSLDEAKAYLQHPVLLERLEECCRLLLALDGLSATDILGFPDDLKLRSSMTLFERADPERKIFVQVLEKYFAGHRDERTLQRL